MYRAMRYFVVNGLFAWCAWLGVHDGVTGAANLTVLWVWVNFAVAAVCQSDSATESIGERVLSHPVPIWLDVLIDMAFVALFIWHGWWWCGVSYLLHSLLMAVIRDKARQRIAAKTAEAS